MRANDIVRHRRERAAGRGQRLLRAAAVVFLLCLLALVVAPLAGIAAGAAGLLSLTRDLPDVTSLEQMPDRYRASPATTRLYAWDEPDADGLRPPVLIDQITDPRLGGAGWVSLDDLPSYVPGAYLAAADPNFMTAAPPPFAPAITGWLNTGNVNDAHSPIIRQLIQTHLRGGAADSSGDTRRAIQDWLLAQQIERRYSHEQLLEWALNTGYYGHLAYGVEAAARVYFGKGAADLTPGEAATLAAVAQNPAANPFDDPAAALLGRAAVLDGMTAAGMISAGEARAARAAPLMLAPPPGSDSAAPEFARLARGELEAILGPERMLAGSLQVETTLDLALQYQAACAAAALVAIRAGQLAAPSGSGPPCPARNQLLESPEPTIGGQVGSAAVVALNPATGEIGALLGDATTPRPIGALVQPLIYLTALSRGYTAATLAMDLPGVPGPTQPDAYTPENGDGRFFGPLRLREGLVAGRTVAAAQVLSWVGVDRVLATARALGLRPDAAEAPADLSFVEGALPATLLDVSQAFAAVGNGGAAVGASISGDSPRPASIRRIVDARGEELYVYEPVTRETLAPELAYLLTDMLADGEARCPALDCPNALELPDVRRAAVATGESAAGDAWAVGYTPERVIGVLAGGDGATGIADAAPLWRALMAQTSGASDDWPRPSGLGSVEVCEASGMLPAREADCATVREWFAPGTEPATTDTMTREVAVNRETGRLATIFTPPQLVERRAYTVYPPEAAAWAAEAGVEAPPTEYDTIRRVPTSAEGVAVLSPEPWSVVSGQWSVVGASGGDDFAYYRVAYFPGLLPEAMQTLVELGESPVEAGELASWDTTLLENGLYTLLLTVVRQDGTFDEVAIPVTVENG